MYLFIKKFVKHRSNQPSKFRTIKCVEINDKSSGTYNVNNEIRFKSTMLKSSLSDYINPYIVVKATIKIARVGENNGARESDERNKRVIFEYCTPFTDCICEINNTQIDNTHYLDVVMPMYNLIEYIDNYPKTWQYYGNITEMSQIIIKQILNRLNLK